MSDVFSLSVVLSFLSLLTTLLTLIRVGSVHFVASHLTQNNLALASPVGMTAVEYTGGHELVRMSWSSKPSFDRPLQTLYDAQKPLSMAKLIMSRHAQRRPPRLPLRRYPNVVAPHPSRLMEEVV
ncbi:hypothetical protein BD410DRAFT_327877 [Rickenella mellea]|uniref:Uncharacterized protein n=1 Tax=Rickenella mellea TaxID=50990 RepID=A0A4Y7QKK4_9AGAM|nr:hypothetical protein BD410DRAFT_327877 [Rickenella mellea]